MISRTYSSAALVASRVVAVFLYGAALSTRCIHRRLLTIVSLHLPLLFHSLFLSLSFVCALLIVLKARALGGVRVAGSARCRTSGGVAVKASVVTVKHEGKDYEVEVDGFDNILEAALDAGIENLSYDCLMVRREAEPR